MGAASTERIKGFRAPATQVGCCRLGHINCRSRVNPRSVAGPGMTTRERSLRSLLMKRRRLRRRSIEAKLVPARCCTFVDALPQQRRLRELFDVLVRFAGVDQHL